LNVTIESILSINPSLPGDESQIFTSSISPSLPNHENGNDNDNDVDSSADKLKSKEGMKAVLRVGSRIITTGVCVITAILLPGFGKVMAFLGSFSAFLICIILPVSLSFPFSFYSFHILIITLYIPKSTQRDRSLHLTRMANRRRQDRDGTLSSEAGAGNQDR